MENMADYLGQRFGNYRLLRVLGTGSFATVYFGEHLHLGTQAALKVLNRNLLLEESDAFRREARTIARLIHPHIVRVFDFGVQRHIPFLVMDYAPYGSLRQRHTNGTPLPLSTILSYITQIAAALDYAHQQKVIHRDIKPENLLLGAREEVLLSDFGLAVVAASSRQPGTTDIAGTIAYMAPEQIQGKPCPASDQYALGVVVYQWLTGILPFQGSPQEMLLQHLATNPPSLRAKGAEIAPGVEAVVLKTLAKEPYHRFPSLEAFAVALQQANLEDSHRQVKQEIKTRLTEQVITVPFGRTPQHALVGRKQELQVLHQLLQETQQQAEKQQERQLAPRSSPQNRLLDRPYISLLGEAGIGKTRLAEEMSLLAQQQGWAVIWGRAHSHEQQMAYRIWIDILRNTLAYNSWPWQEVADSPAEYQPLKALLPELAEIFPSNVLVAGETGEQVQFRLWEALQALFTAMSTRAPLLLVLDDLHWTDHSSQELLGYLVRTLADQRVLLVGTSREREIIPTQPLHALFRLLQKQHMLTRMVLSPLTESEIGQLVADLSLPIVRGIQRQAAGNPFFAEEFARFSRHRAEEAAEKPLSAAFAPGSKLPPGISTVFEQRINQLSEASQRMLYCAAVLGNTFSFNLIQLMQNSDALRGNEEALLTQLEEVLQAGLVTEENSGAHILYHFWHPLLAEYLYQHLSAARRASLHRRVAQRLQERYNVGEEEKAATIVFHLVKGGGESASIIRYAKQAGDYAYQLFAYPEAEKQYRLALEYTSSPSLTTPSEERLLLVFLRERLGECLRVQGHFDEALDSYGQALAIYKQTSFLEQHLPEQQYREKQALLALEIGKTFYNSGNTLSAWSACRQAEQVLQQARIASKEIWARLRLEQGHILVREGNYVEALRAAEEALQAFRDQGDFSPEKELASVNIGRAYNLLAMIYLSLGQSRIALEHFQDALAIYEQCKSLRDSMLSYSNIGDLHLRQVNFVQAKQAIQRSSTLAEQLGDVPTMSINRGNYGVLAQRQGKLKEAQAYYQQALELAEQMKDLFYESVFRSYLAQVFQDQGNLLEATHYAATALRIGRGRQMIPCLSGALVTVGRLRVAQARATWDDPKQYHHFLQRAKQALLHAFALEAQEIEDKLQGKVILGEVFWLQGDLEQAYQQTKAAFTEAQRHELVWIELCAQHLLGTILAASGKIEEGERSFHQATERLQHAGMRLEYARALRNYGTVLLQHHSLETAAYQQGRSYLGQAWEMFLECDARLDAEEIEHFLSRNR
jgi:serine/threonine protein kinase/tetratricopeptide (TPR) repeat protein